MKFSLILVASAAVTAPKQCVAFAPAISNILKNQASIQNENSLEPLQAFRFPSTTEQEPVIQAPSDESITSSLLEPVTDVCILALRLSTCALLIHHGLHKIQNVDDFSANVVAKAFGFLPGDPSFWTLSAAATQVAGSGLLALGVLSRPVSFSMMMTMIVAVVFHLLNTGLEGFPLAVVSQHSYNYELAAMYVGVLAYFSASGAGKFSLDEQVLGGELELYDSALNKVFNLIAEPEPEVVVEEKAKVSLKLPWN
jgi:uncharacterized membrane protein YphA (DoxX/SURF4 family)